MKKTIAILFMCVLPFLFTETVQAQRISDVITIGGKTSDTASYRGSTAYPWTSSSFIWPNYPTNYKAHFDIDTTGFSGNKGAKYRIDTQESLDGTNWYRCARSTFGSGGWTRGDTNWILTNQTTTTSPPVAAKYMRFVITPYDSVQLLRIKGALIRW